MTPAPQDPEGAVQAVSQRPVTVEAAAGWSSLPEWLTVRALVIDTGTGRRGEVQPWPYYSERPPTSAWLRPEGGGKKWTAPIDGLRPAHGDPAA
ncbi:hypothetical protein BX286_2547 [Streptomyces sp. 3211.6]|nr:hypothetical protein BX286_2547 [Streptomyces sp. 3211.6]RPF40462.1 hypothetical protein EDD96_4223 [Streptomyces sp. Ag109_G2-6]